MKKVLFVCLGNIARSPLAKLTFNEIIKQRGLEDFFSSDSAGTAGYHIGKPADRRSIEVAEKHGYELKHAARKLSLNDFDEFDHIAVMDEKNFEDIHNLYHKTKKRPPAAEKLFLIRDYDPDVRGVQEVKDPFYDGAAEFEEVYQQLYKSNEKLIDHLVDLYDIKLEEEEEEGD